MGISGKAVAGMAAVAALGIGIPYVIGLRTETGFRASIAELERQSPYPIEVAVYRRGLLSAEAETTVTIPLPPDAHDHDHDDAQPAELPKTVQLRLHHAISHGPRLDGLLRSARLVTTPMLDAEQAAALQPLFGSEPPFTLVTDIGLGGAVHGSLRSPPVDTASSAGAAAPAPLQLQWAGIESRYSLAGGHLLLQLDAPGLKLSGAAGVQGSLGPIQLSADMNRIDDSPLWTGSSRLSLASAAFAAGDAPGFVLEALAIDSDTRTVDQRMNSGARFAATTLELAGSRYRQLQLNLALDHLDAAAASELSLALNRYQQKNGADAAKADPAAMMAELKPVLGRLVASQPEFRVDELSFTGPDGAVKLTGRLRYIGDANLDDFAPTGDLEGEARFEAPLATFNTLMATKLRGDLASSAGVAPAEVPPEVLASALQGNRESLLQQGVLLVDGGRVSSALSFKSGVLSINGRTLGGGPR